ncbi:MAG TPA: adenosylmethionine--8-amino-7-oxononanoate transaminase [Flavitalea sp.]|nr:adenosylmethionine--8-amino-7-oxononanoate transaminase [Flavitalea sp.]
MQNLSERDAQVIWHPFTPQKYLPLQIPIEKGDGLYLIDTNGKKYIDAISSWWVTLHGHAHPYIAQKIYEQALKLEQVIFAGFTHEPAVRLAERLLEILPGDFTKVFYSDNGSTSTEVAIKMALQYWWNQGSSRRKVLCLQDAYHGDTFGAMSVSERSVFTRPFHDRLFDVEVIPRPDATNIESILKFLTPEIACFIYEPLVQGAGGLKMYEAEFLDELLKHCKQHGIICIADEVMTGFGRTGKLFASEYCEQKPDIICLSKGLTGGTLPLGVTACTAEIHEAFMQDDKYKTFFHGHSFTANPLGCTAALASLDLLLEPSCMETIQMYTNMHAEFCKVLSKSFPDKARNVRSLGTILAFEWEDANSNYLNTIGTSITQKALELGLFIRPLGNTIYLMPPYCVREDIMSDIHDMLIKIFNGQLS